MYKKLTMILCVMLCICTAAAAETFLSPLDTLVYDCADSTYRMSIPQNDGSCCIMGTSAAQLQDWISLASDDGTIKWTVACPASSYYSGAVQLDETLYILVNEYGKPVEERKPYLLPIDADGKQLAPIGLPSWTADAAIVNVDSGILIYSNGTAPLRAVLFDAALQTVWEIENASLPAELYLITDFIQYGGDYVLLAADREGRESGLVFMDPGSGELDVKLIHEEGYAAAIACDQSAIHILMKVQDKENASYHVLTANRADDRIAKQEIALGSNDVTLSDLWIVEQGYLFSGSKQDGSKPPEAVLALKRFEDEKAEVQTIAAVKEILLSQTFLSADHTIMVFGIHAGDDGQGDGRIVCSKYALVP